MDITRWIVAEAWIANGLRVNWAGSYARAESSWIRSDGGYSYRYAGRGEWEVLDQDNALRVFEKPVSPALSTEDMVHELCHFLVATPDQRAEVNFGAGNGDLPATPEGRASEEAALAAERVLHAIVAAASRAVGIANGAKR